MPDVNWIEAQLGLYALEEAARNLPQIGDVRLYFDRDPDDGSQEIDVAAGGRSFSNLRTNVINMRSDDVTVTCTQNCH